MASNSVVLPPLTIISKGRAVTDGRISGMQQQLQKIKSVPQLSLISKRKPVISSSTSGKRSQKAGSTKTLPILTKPTNLIVKKFEKISAPVPFFDPHKASKIPLLTKTVAKHQQESVVSRSIIVDDIADAIHNYLDLNSAANLNTPVAVVDVKNDRADENSGANLNAPIGGNDERDFTVETADKAVQTDCFCNCIPGLNDANVDEIARKVADYLSINDSKGKQMSGVMANLFPIKSPKDLERIEHNYKNTENFEIRLPLADYIFLKTFEDIQTVNLRRRFGSGSMNRYNFLSSFSSLTHLTLTSYTFCGCDLYYPLAKLATKNIVKLKVFSNLEHAITFNEADRPRIMQSSFSNFLSLLVLELDVRNFRLAGDLRCEFILHFAAQLKNLASFTLQSSRLTNVNKLIETLPQIRTFSMSQITIKHLPVEMRKIVRTLRAIRQNSDTEDGSNLLQLIVNIEQWRELQVYKDINKLTETIIDPYVEPHNQFRRCPSEIETPSLGLNDMRTYLKLALT